MSYTNDVVSANNVLIDNIVADGSTGTVNQILQKNSSNVLSWLPYVNKLHSDFYISINNSELPNGFNPFTLNRAFGATNFVETSGMTVIKNNITVSGGKVQVPNPGFYRVRFCFDLANSLSIGYIECVAGTVGRTYTAERFTWNRITAELDQDFDRTIMYETVVLIEKNHGPGTISFIAGGTSTTNRVVLNTSYIHIIKLDEAPEDFDSLIVP